MTTTYEPNHPQYRDEADVRAELSRVFQVCDGCRRCVDLCPSFPTLFELLDRHDDRDAGRLTPAEQDEVVAECFQCKRCYLACPYVPGRDELSIDVPRLMLRAGAMRHAQGHVPARQRATDRLLGRSDLVGRVATRIAPAANRALGARSGSPIRRVLAAVTGVSAVRLLPPYSRERFSTWFAKRPEVSLRRRQGAVTVFPTCLVEYHDPGIGKDLVRVYERNRIECDVSDIGCCGAPLLHAGDIDRFAAVAERNVTALADAVRRGRDVVVAQPTCAYVLGTDYPEHVDSADAQLVARHTFDAAEYLMRVHGADDTMLDTAFTGDAPASITYHAPCHLRARSIGFPGRDLMKLTGARVRMVQQCSGIGGAWGYRGDNEEASLELGRLLGEAVEQAAGDVVAGDCHLANTAIVEQTGRLALHPVQVLARAYGIAADG